MHAHQGLNPQQLIFANCLRDLWRQAPLCVMRRLVNIVYGMLKHRTAYVMPDLPEKEAV